MTAEAIDAVGCVRHWNLTEGVRACARCSRPFCEECLVEILGHPYCAACKNEQLLDLHSGLDPMGLPLAGIGRRFLAILVDSVIISIPIMVIYFGVIAFITLVLRRQFWPGLVFAQAAMSFSANIIYEALMLSRRGQTLGKMIVQIKVVRPDGSPLSRGQAWGRAVTKFLLGSLYVGYIPAIFTVEKTGLHDMIARTRVIRVRP